MHNAVIRRMPRARFFVWAFAVLTVLTFVLGAACSSGPIIGEGADVSDGTDGGASIATGVDVCATPNDGCPCPTNGAVVACGQVETVSGSYVSCSMGTRSCTNGTWGACVGNHVVQKRANDRPIHAGLGSGGMACGSANVCDPYCQTIVDTPSGLDAGSAFTTSDAGLTLSGSGGSTASDAGLLGILPIPSVCLPVCGNGTVCVGGACVCPAYETLCNGTCIPTSVDPNNCGGCGTKCTGAQVCSGGVCSSGCLPGLSACINSCVDEQNDSSNCGSCGHVCGVGTGCAGGTCVATVGTAACATSITGVIKDPAKLRPVYGAQVYVPIGAVPGFTAGVGCDTCANLFSSPTLVSVATGADGSFTLTGVPSGAPFTLVIQLGRWRRQVTIPAITQCGTYTLPAAQAHLPARHVRTVMGSDEASDAADPDIPLMAIITGQDDATECLLAHMGLATSEFTLPTGTGRIHMYSYDQSKGLTTTGTSGVTWKAADPGATLSGGNGQGSVLFGTASNLNKYNFVLAPCADDPGGPSTAMRTNMQSWVNAGGRLFTSHHGLEDWVYNQPGWTALANYIGAIPFANDNPDPNDRPSVSNPLNASVNTSFATGVAMAQFIQNTWGTAGGPGGTVPPYGIVPMPNSRHDVNSVNTPTVPWLSADSTSSGRSGAGPQVSIFTFDAPVGSPAANQCGRVVVPEMHVSGASTGTFPAECGSVPGPLTGQELSFEFMMYESMACLQSVTATPPATVPPASCTAISLPSILGSGCSAALAQQTFTSGLCSCNGFNVNSNMLVDSYSSVAAPYAPGGVSGTIATNGNIQSNAVIDDEGALIAAGSGGITFVSSTASTVKKTITSGGNVTGKVNVSGNGAVVGTVSGGAVISGTTTHPPLVLKPCDCLAADVIPINTIVAAHATLNDDASIGITASSLSSLNGAARLDLPCGNYYVNGFNNNGALTIDAHGRTALYIQGDINANGPIAFTLEPGAELDVFLTGNINTNSGFVLGSPNYPAMARMYVGGSGTVNLNASGVRLAGEWYNANGQLNVNTTAAQYGSLYTGGITLNAALTLHVDTDITTIGTKECGTNLTSQTFVRDYVATCPTGYGPVWQNFEWQATVPTGTSIAFTAQTADTEAQLGGAPTYPNHNPPVSAGTATSTTSTWTNDAHTVDYHLQNDVAAAPQFSKQWLRVNMTLNPSGNTAPTLQQWQQLYDCKPTQ